METILTTSEMIEQVILNERLLNEGGTPRTLEMRVMSNLRNACDVFARVSFEHIRMIHSKSEVRGLSAELTPGEVGECYAMKILTYCMAGRIMITIKNKNEDYITLCGGEDPGENSMAGLHAIGCDPNVALDLLEMLTNKWYLVYDNRGKNNVNKFKEDSNISIL